MMNLKCFLLIKELVLQNGRDLRDLVLRERTVCKEKLVISFTGIAAWNKDSPGVLT